MTAQSVKSLCTVDSDALRRALALPGDTVNVEYTPETNLGYPVLMVGDTLLFVTANGSGDYGHASFAFTVSADRLRNALQGDMITLADTGGILTANGAPITDLPQRQRTAHDTSTPALKSPLPTLRKLHGASKKYGGLKLLDSGDYAAFVSDSKAYVIHRDQNTTHIVQAALSGGRWTPANDASGKPIAQTFATVDTFEIELIRS